MLKNQKFATIALYKHASTNKTQILKLERTLTQHASTPTHEI
jgi:hypothetical protein